MNCTTLGSSIRNRPFRTRSLIALAMGLFFSNWGLQAMAADPPAWERLADIGYRKVDPRTVEPVRIDGDRILEYSSSRSGPAGDVDIDAATAEAVARSRSLWEWGRKPTSVHLFPVVGLEGEVTAYEALLVFGSRDPADLKGLHSDWEGFLADYRSEFAARRTELSSVDEILANLDAPMASVLVSATLDAPPVLWSHLGPPAFLESWPGAAGIAGEVLGTGDPALVSLIDLGGPSFAFEFAHAGRTVIVRDRPTWCWIEGDPGWAGFAAKAASIEQDRILQAGSPQALAATLDATRAANGTALGTWLDGAVSPQVIGKITGYLAHFDCFALANFDDEAWTYSDEVRALLTQSFNYYDNRLNYGNLVKYHYNHTGILYENLCHVSDLQAQWGDYFATWDPVEFHDVMKYVANSRGYSFVDGLSLEGGLLDWHFDEGRAEIDADRPFIWTRSGEFDYSFVVIGYDTGPSPEEWLGHNQFADEVGLPWRVSHVAGYATDTHFAGPMPGGEGYYTAELTYPDGNHEINACYTTETLRAGARTTIRWENWDNPATRVELDYSNDGGRTWTPIVTDREDVEWYRWDVPCGAVGDSSRVRMRQFNVLGQQESADGSFGNFIVDPPYCADLVIESPLDDGSPCRGTSVLFRWEPLACAALYRLHLAEVAPRPHYDLYHTTNNELVIPNLKPGTRYQWFIRAQDECGSWHGYHESFFNVGELPLDEPTLVSPADGSPCVTYPNQLSWNPVVDAAGYRVELGFTCGGDVQAYDVTANELPVTWLEAGRTYFWRVAAVDDCGGQGAWSPCRSFTVPVETLPAPVLAEPSDGSTGQLVPGELVWTALAGAVAYEVQLGTACGTGATTLIDPAATSHPYAGLEGNTTYHWRVRGRTGCGNWGAWSACFSFTTRPNATWFVRPDGSGDWPTIQAAVDASIDGDIIELDDGIFLGVGNKDVDLGIKSLVIRSRNGVPEACTINVEGHDTHPYRGFRIAGGQGRDTVLEGFTIENAYLAGTGAGAGMMVANSDPTLRHLDFVYNHAYDGGALFLYNSDAMVYDCEFRLNTARNSGGAIRTSANPQGDIVECRFFGNSAVWGGGAIYNYGSSPDTRWSVFAGNSSDHWGGAIHNSEATSTPWIFRCTIDGNWAPQGGGIYNRSDSAPVIENCLITGSLEGEAVYCTGGATVSVTCTDVYGNAGGDWVGCLAGQAGNPGNRSVDPWYCLPANYDYNLHFDSPVASENNPGCYQIGALGIGCGPHEPVTVLVEPDGTGDYPTIQAAIDDLPSGSTILLGDGVFTGDGNRNLMTYAKQLRFRSQSQRAENCIIDPQGTAGESNRAFYFSGSTPSTRLEYITFRGGMVNGDGGAILCEWGASPTITVCVFEENVAWGNGGAIAVKNGASPDINNCTFRNNGALGHGGAVIAKNEATLEIRSCWFHQNSAVAGGAVGATDLADLTLLWCVFDRNDASWGGALLSYAEATLTVQECTMARNTAYVSGKARPAVAGFADRDMSEYLLGEKAVTGGGGVFCGDTASVAIDGSIIAFSQQGEAVLCDSTGIVEVTCSDLFGNLGGDWLGCVEGLLGVNGNISADPLFCNTHPEDLYLAENSPCGQGSPEPGCDYMGALPTECGLSHVEQPTPLLSRSVLHPAVPNPFNAGTEISFDLHRPGRVSLEVFDISGRRIVALVDGRAMPAGRHSETWSGRDGSGRRMAGGVYFYRLSAEGFSETRRMVLVK